MTHIKSFLDEKRKLKTHPIRSPFVNNNLKRYLVNICLRKSINKTPWWKEYRGEPILKLKGPLNFRSLILISRVLLHVLEPCTAGPQPHKAMGMWMTSLIEALLAYGYIVMCWVGCVCCVDYLRETWRWQCGIDMG